MEAILTSTAVVALAEIGDKTQLLAILLATRFNRPVPIILGILFATLANHALAALLGASAAAFLDSPVFRYAIGLSFVAMAAWTLIPDKFEDDEAPKPRFGAFLTTLVAFFLVEMGDKTQIATVALGAQDGGDGCSDVGLVGHGQFNNSGGYFTKVIVLGPSPECRSVTASRS